ncbi:hypothetical protein ABZ845_31705, partial [Streptomyces sp. NPDC047022]
MTTRPPSEDSTRKNGTGEQKTGARKTAEETTAERKKAVAKKAAAGVKKTAVKKTAAKQAATKQTASKAPEKKAAARKTTAKASSKAGAKTAAKKTVAEPAPLIPAARAGAEEAAVSEVSAVPTTGTAAVGAGHRERLLSGTHHDPHAVLGAHEMPGGVALRAFRPYALSVTVVTGSLRAELRDDGDGFFSALLPLRDVPSSYRLLVEYEGSVQDTEDAYGFLPALGELDLHLIGEGRHEELWKALGAHPMTHRGVTGTRFSVWAPNARGVRVCGSFNFWNGTAHPMRSLGSSGVWELFVPGIGEGELYKFEITRPDGSKTLRADPMARRTEAPPNTSSIVEASRHEWGDG